MQLTYLLLILLSINVIAKPTIDPGVFVIQGVSTCLHGNGYCLLGAQCDVDKDFLEDESGGHCSGLLNAFTPRISFVCCRYNPALESTTEAITTTPDLNVITGDDEILVADDEIFGNEDSGNSSAPSSFNSASASDKVNVKIPQPQFPIRLPSPIVRDPQPPVIIQLDTDNAIAPAGEYAQERSEGLDKEVLFTTAAPEEEEPAVPSAPSFVTFGGSVGNCGYKGETNLRTDPGEINSSEWCWLATIVESRAEANKYLCNGVFIRNDVVLTTATCTKRIEQSVKSFKIQVNNENKIIADNWRIEEIIDILMVAIHPKFTTTGGASIYDIGILKLRTSSYRPLKSNYCTVCLQSGVNLPSQKEENCSAVGHNLNRLHGNSVIDDLSLVHVDIDDEEVCKEEVLKSRYSSFKQSSSSLLCTTETINSAQPATCKTTVEKGSPLACLTGGHWFLKGLKSWKEGCTTAYFKDIYANVLNQIDFIKQVIGNWDIFYTRMSHFKRP